MNYLCFDLAKDPFAVKQPEPDLSGNKYDEVFYLLLHFSRIIAWVDDFDYIKKYIQPRFDMNIQYCLKKIKRHPDNRVNMMEWMSCFSKFKSIQGTTSDPYFSHRPDMYEIEMFSYEYKKPMTIFFGFKPIRKAAWYRVEVPLQVVENA